MTKLYLTEEKNIAAFRQFEYIISGMIITTVEFPLQQSFNTQVNDCQNIHGAYIVL